MTFRRNRVFWLSVLVTVIWHLGCSTDTGTGNQDSEDPDPLPLTFEEPPFDLQGNSAQFARDVAYGPYAENVFDIFLADSEDPTPLVIFIHGGGFTDGDKRIIYLTGRAEIREFLANRVSFATIEYRLLDDVDTTGVIKSLNDSKYCLQFLRYHHEQLNVDPQRIVVYGSSAGAGTSLWLAFSDDMADPAADDPVLRESTRVHAAGAKATQSTYDLLKWETIVFSSLNLTMEEMAELPGASEQGLLSFYGAASFEDLGTAEFIAYRARVDMLSLMSSDDPGFWVKNEVENAGEPADLGELFHHALHAVALSDQAAAVGAECMIYAPPLGIADPSGDDVVDFLLDRLDD